MQEGEREIDILDQETDKHIENDISWDAYKNSVIANAERGDIEQFASDSFQLGWIKAKEYLGSKKPQPKPIELAVCENKSQTDTSNYFNPIGGYLCGLGSDKDYCFDVRGNKYRLDCPHRKIKKLYEREG